MNRSKFYFLFFLFAAILAGGVFVFSPWGGHVKEAKAILAGGCDNYVEIDGACGSVINSCNAGYNFTDLPDTSTEAKWQCWGCNVIDHCSAPLPSASPLTVSCSPKTSTAVVNDVPTFSASPAGGTLPYSYSWSPLTCGAGTTNSTQQCKLWFGAPATYTQTVKVTDSAGKTASDSCTITVSSACTPKTEICDGKDNDCDGAIDENSVCTPTPPPTKVCTPGATQSCSISGCTIPAGGIQQCKDDGSGWSGCACKAACTANFTPSSINAGQSATFNATVSGWAFTQPVWSCSGGATASGNVTSSISKTFTNVLSPIYCQVGVAGYYGSTASCPAPLNVTSQQKYSCNSSGACVADSNGSFTNSNCNGQCVATPTTGTVEVRGIVNGVEMSFSVNYNVNRNGSFVASGSQSFQTFSNRETGTYSLSNISGYPSNYIFDSTDCDPSSCFLNAGTSVSLRMRFHTQQGPTTGTIQVRGIVDNAERNFNVNYTISGQSSATGSFVPATFSNRATGTYSLSGISGYPSNYIYDRWDCDPGNCALTAGGNVALRMYFHTVQQPQNQLPVGFHDNNDNASCTVNGWTTDPDDRNIDLTVKIYSDGTFVKSAIANKSRSDLVSVCPNGTCAFSENLSGLIAQGITHQIRARALDAQTQEEVDLGSTPQPITCTLAPVNGECGSAQGVQSPTAPSTNLCKTGNPTSVSDGGTVWIWGCLGSNGGSPASCSAPKTITPQIITISGRVYNQTSGAGFSGATIDTCHHGNKTTDANGSFSFVVNRGDGFCLRVSPETRTGFNGPFLNNNATVDQTFKTYEHQVAGKNCPVEGCYTEANIWDRASDTGYDFRYQPVSGPSCDTSYPNDQYHVCYFDGTNPPTGANPVLAQTNESTIDHDWGAGQVNASGKSDQVSGIWRGRINFPAGNYVFHTLSDDGVLLNLEGNGDVISNWTDHAPTQNNSSSITLPAGSRNVTLKWYENGGGARVKLWWDFTPPSGPPSCPDAPVSITPSNGQTITVASDPAFITLSWAATSDTAFYDVRLDDGTSERYHHPAWTSTVCGGSTSASPHYVCENGIFATSLAGVQVHPGKTYAYWVDPVPTNPSCSYVNKGGSFSVVRESGDGDGDGDGDGNGGGCNDECSFGASQCTDSTHVQICGSNFDGDSCLEWGPTPPNACLAGQQCISGSCAALPPNPPASFTASAGPACNIVNFFWTDTNSPPADSFTISCNSGAITISGLTGNSHTFTGAQGNTSYNCSITAVRSGLSSSARPLDTGAVQTPKCPDFGLACFDVGGGACSGFGAILSTAGTPKNTNTVILEVTNAGTSFTGSVELSLQSVSGAASVFTVVPHFGATTLAPGQTTTLYVTVSGAQPIGTYNGFVNIKGHAPSLGTGNDKIIAVPLKVEVKSPGFIER